MNTLFAAIAAGTLLGAAVLAPASTPSQTATPATAATTIAPVARVSKKVSTTASDHADTEMTAPLRDPGYFSKCFIDAGALAWPNGFDSARNHRGAIENRD